MPRLCDFETCRKQASYGQHYGNPYDVEHIKKNMY